MADNKSLLTMARDKQLDTLLVVRPAGYGTPPLVKPGYGFYLHPGMLVNRCMYGSYIIGVYDVATEKEIAWYWGANLSGKGMCFYRSKTISWRNSFDEYSESEKEVMREELYKTLDMGIEYALKELALIPGREDRSYFSGRPGQ